MSKSKCDNKEYLHYQIEGNSEIFLMHIFNINYLNPYRNKDKDESRHKITFREILSDKNLSKLKKEYNHLQVYKANLNKGDILFIPSFYFKQIKSIGEINANINFRYKTHSRILNNLMISLFDENITHDN